jgi:hypothetical protein
MRLVRLARVELEDFGFVMVEPDDGVIMGHGKSPWAYYMHDDKASTH